MNHIRIKESANKGPWSEELTERRNNCQGYQMTQNDASIMSMPIVLINKTHAKS